MATKLDLADAQLLGFASGKNNPDGIVSLVQSMGLTKSEWVKWKEKYPIHLCDTDIWAIDNHFKIL